MPFSFHSAKSLFRSDVACSAVTPFYNTVDRITDDLKCVGKPTYVPPYPKDAFLPEYLKGLKELVVFIATEETSKIPTLEMAKQQFVVYDPKGVCVIPPGSGLLNLFEQEVKTDFGKVSLDDLFIILPKLIVNNLELASGFEIDSRDKVVRVKITNSVYKDLYSHEKPLKSIQHIGCPLVSAVACALSETTGKLVVIGTINLSLKSQKIEVQYQLLEG